MENPILYMMNAIRENILQAAAALQQSGVLPEGELAEFDVEIPKDITNGDFSTNFAMKHARVFRLPPRAIGEKLVEALGKIEYVKAVSVAGAGFINFEMEDSYFATILNTALERGENYGRSDRFHGERVMVEFVSANPTGPMHMGNARGGIIGDCLASLLDWAGADVHREFYVNDAGNQVSLFGKSLHIRLLQQLGQDVEFPEDGYHGDDIKVLADEFLKATPDIEGLSEEDVTAQMVAFGLEKNIARMQSDLGKYKISYDEWFRESRLHKSGYVAETVAILEEKGALYEKEGAKWFKATDFGYEKDEVLVKANGFYTYFAVDIAYHRHKFVERKFDRVIDVFGADHHGHTLRFWAAMRALGLDENKLQFVLMQLVRLMRDGEIVRMSKRTGKSITLSDLLDEIPVDAARFFFNSRASDTTMDFDLSLATRQDSENPLYYVQYAHARICSILRNLEQNDIAYSGTPDFALLQSGEERDLIRQIALLPQEIVSGAEAREPSRITAYCEALAAAFHKFYNACPIKNEAEALRDARIGLCIAARQTLKNSLALMNITAPEQM
ncbi:MAG: arginine--tRNA ligase [Clostridia bacterium]|nr:arginine--tRNA ligase [Clostridia bacterium]